jgi:hypothetical protein
MGGLFSRFCLVGVVLVAMTARLLLVSTTDIQPRVTCRDIGLSTYDDKRLCVPVSSPAHLAGISVPNVPEMQTLPGKEDLQNQHASQQREMDFARAEAVQTPVPAASAVSKTAKNVFGPVLHRSVRTRNPTRAMSEDAVVLTSERGAASNGPRSETLPSGDLAANGSLDADISNAGVESVDPSRWLGEGNQGSLLTTTLAEFVNTGQEAAMRLATDGKAPTVHGLKQDTVRILAAAANQQLASLIEDATAYGEDNGIRFLRNLELQTSWFPGERPTLEARTIDALYESNSLDHTVFLEAGVRSDFEVTTANAGLGYRYVVPDIDWMFGLNVFYDRQFPIDHERLSIGLEASTTDLTFFGNRYIALSGWASKSADFDEKPLSGWDVGVVGRLPELEDLKLSVSAFVWTQKTEEDVFGLRLSADYDVTSGLRLGGTVSGDDSGEWRVGMNFTYDLGGQKFSGGSTSTSTVLDQRLAFVNRENAIRTETRAVPNEYTAAFIDPDVNSSNAQSLSFLLASAPSGGQYSFAIVSSGGGTPVTGEGVVQSDPQTIGGIDVSTLADGTLTLTVQVISAEGAMGPEVTATIPKSTVLITVATATTAPDPTNMNPIPFTITFSMAVEGFVLSDLTVANGTAANLQTSDSITWTVDVTPTAQGTVSLTVPATGASGGGNTNSASNTTSVTYDGAAPTGYTSFFLTTTINSANQGAAGLQFSGGEIGAAFSFTISSSGGGTPVTGSGTVSSNPQQVTALDLSALGDGTLTLSLTLTDTLGNVGSAVNTTATKDARAPKIIAIVPPAAGTFDDL